MLPDTVCFFSFIVILPLPGLIITFAKENCNMVAVFAAIRQFFLGCKAFFIKHLQDFTDRYMMKMLYKANFNGGSL